MVSILYWNIAGRVVTLQHVVCLAQAHSIDVFLFAESPADLDPTVAALNDLDIGIYREAGKVQPKVRALVRLESKDFDHLFTTIGGETAVWSIRAPKVSPPEVMLAVTHLPAKSGGSNDANQLAVAQFVAAELAEFEDLRQHRNTVFVGDFNMHPYEPGMTHATGIHGLMTERLANMPDRVYRKRLYRRFYNPMWGLFGDRTAGPPGTYYWRSSEPHNPHWEMFDQVLLRPPLIGRLHDLRILDSDGVHSLVKADRTPDKKHMSDHLPLLFLLDI